MQSFARDFGCRFQLHDEVATNFERCYDCVLDQIRFEVEVKAKWHAKILASHVQQISPHIPFHYSTLHYAGRKIKNKADRFATVGGDRLRLVIIDADVVKSCPVTVKRALQDDGTRQPEDFINVPVPSPTMIFYDRSPATGNRWTMWSKFDRQGRLVYSRAHA
jgi:hypothetical protein